MGSRRDRPHRKAARGGGRQSPSGSLGRSLRRIRRSRSSSHRRRYARGRRICDRVAGCPTGSGGSGRRSSGPLGWGGRLQGRREPGRGGSSPQSIGSGGIPIVGQTRPGVAVARAVAAAAGLEALIDRLGPKADRALAESLLGDVLVVEGWAAGWDVVHRNHQLRAVTPEGDLISVNGISVSVPDGATPAMVEAAGIALDRIERDLARVVSRFTTQRRQFDQSRQAERAALESLESIEAKLAGAAEALGRSTQDCRRPGS